MSGVNIFPELTNGARLEHLTVGTAATYSQRLAELMVGVLTVYGPLPAAGVRYFLNRQYDLRIVQNDVTEVLLSQQDIICRFGNVYRTVAQEAVGIGPASPVPEDYAIAYYELLEMFELVRQHPKLAHTPLTMLRDFLQANRDLTQP